MIILFGTGSGTTAKPLALAVAPHSVQSAALHLVSIEGRVVLGRRRRVARSSCAERPSRPGFAVASTWVIVRGPLAVFVLCGRLDSGSSC